MNVRIVVLALTGISLACGGGGGGGAAFTGTIKGQTMNSNSQISGNFTSSVNGTTISGGFIGITDVSNACTVATNNTQPKNSKLLEIIVADVNQSSFAFSVPSGTGTFTVYNAAGSSPPAAHAAIVSFITGDATCATVAAKSANGASGTVTLTRIAGGSYAGSYDVTFDSGDHVTGSFDASNCPGISNTLNATTSPTCT